MPVSVEHTPTGMWLIHDPKYETRSCTTPDGSRTVCYARVSSAGQKTDLRRQADRLKAFALSMGVEAPEVVTETGSGMDEHRRRLNRLLADPTVGTIVVEHRDRLARMNFELVENALKAQGRRVIVVDDAELDDDLVRDMTEVLTSFCARLYGRRAAKHRAQAALEAMRGV
ncbi:integrase [Bifidobacterium pseudolongum subsp. globosum]|nr:integrase [Bifidobacterium pseudolongum subsp. globosum]